MTELIAEVYTYNTLRDNHQQFIQSDLQTWLETRRQQTYQKYVEKGLQTDPSVIQFYCESLKIAEGLRLENPSIQTKSFFSLNGVNALEQKKEEEEKMQPVISVSSNKVFISPKKEQKCQLTIKNDGEVNVVYQISIMNAANYVMSPICAILLPKEELTLNITRKVGNEKCVFGIMPSGQIPGFPGNILNTYDHCSKFLKLSDNFFFSRESFLKKSSSVLTTVLLLKESLMHVILLIEQNLPIGK